MSNPRAEPIELCLYLHRESPKAILVSDDGDEAKAVWLALSQISVKPRTRGNTLLITMPTWLATSKQLLGQPAEGQTNLF